MSIYLRLCGACRKVAASKAQAVSGEQATKQRKRDRRSETCDGCRYTALVDLDPGQDGLRRRRSLGVFRTKKEAEKAEREALTNKDRGIDLAPQTVTLATVLERYLNDREALGREAKTLEEYRRFATLYINPHLGNHTIAKLRPAHVSAWIAKLLEQGGRNGRPLSLKTGRHAFALLSSALRWGMRMELVARNVCECVTPPSPRRSEAKALTSDELTRLVDAARGTRWENFVTLALMLGARRGELLALTWADVNFDGRSVTIRGSLSQTKAGGVRLKGTKTNRVRTIPLSATALDAFRRLHVLQAEERLRAGALFANTGAVFTNEIGARITPKAATNGFSRIAKKAAISTTRLHDIRHTTATNLIAGHVDVRTVASILGHTNASVTLGLYSHVVEGAERAAIDILADRLGKAVGERSA